MSITSDIRSYADTTIDQARTQLSNLTGTARTNVSDLRTQAEKALNIDAIKTAVEPYLARTRQYRSTVTDRAGELFDGVYGTVTKDKRVAKVLDTVNDRVVKPVSSITGIGAAPKSAPKKTTTARKPAAKKTTAKKAASTRPAAKKTTAKKTTAAKKSTATKATS